jgi:hypothetical protein
MPPETLQNDPSIPDILCGTYIAGSLGVCNTAGLPIAFTTEITEKNLKKLRGLSDLYYPL